MIYTVCTLRSKKHSSKFGQAGGHVRMVGYFETFEDARKCVIENWGDIYEEGYYKYALVQETEAGLYPTCTEHWYEWLGGRGGGYTACEKPDEFKQIIGFGIG